MVFPFFRKGGQPPPAGGPKPSTRPAPPTERGRATTILAGAIEVEEIAAGEASGDYSAEEEAAILYANDRVDQALLTLAQCVREAPCRNDPRPWLMLFELYLLRGEREPFEELALEFVVQFERSPPAWPERADAGEKAASRAPAGIAFAPTGMLSAQDGPALRKMGEAAGAAGGLRLDLSRLTGVEPAGADALLQLLQGLKKAGVEVHLGGSGNLIGLLQAATEDGRTAGHWLLLLELYQILGMRDEFEDLAIRYAVALEISPPSWEQAPSPGAKRKPEPPRNGDVLPEDEAFRPEGPIAGNCEQELEKLVRYGSGRQEVCLDLSRVPRVDFGCIGNLLAALMQLHGAGKRVVIRGANEMVAALFGVMGVEQFAVLERKKWR